MTREEAAEAVERLAANGEHDAAREVAAANWRLWLTAGDVEGGRRMLATALAGDATPSRARALALYADGALAFRAGDRAASRARNDEALAAARVVGDREAEALALVGLSRVALRDGDYDAVCSLATSARELVQDLEPSADVAPLHLLAAGTRLAGRLDDAAALYDESLELNRRLDDSYMVAVEHHNLGHVELHRGNVEIAERHFAYARAARTDNPYDNAMTHLNQASLAHAAGRRDEAVELLARAESTLDAAGIALDPDDRYEVDWLRERL